MIFGAILAGGVGSRMNIADMPKQFLLISVRQKNMVGYATYEWMIQIPQKKM